MEQEYRMMNEPPSEGGPVNAGSDRANAMATVSLVMGILAVLTICCCYGGIIFGSLGIIFAVLSRTDEPISGFARGGVILSVIGLVAALLLFGMLMGGMLG